MNANQLTGRLGIQREGKRIIARKGLSKATTKLYRKWWGPGAIIETPHPIDNTKSVYTLKK